MQDYQLTKTQRDLIKAIRRLDDVQAQALMIAVQTCLDTHNTEEAKQAAFAYLGAHGRSVPVAADL